MEKSEGVAYNYMLRPSKRVLGLPDSLFLLLAVANTISATPRTSWAASLGTSWSTGTTSKRPKWNIDWVSNHVLFAIDRFSNSLSASTVTQSEQDRSCILLLRMQKKTGDFLWVHLVLQVRDSQDSTQQSVIVCTNQVLRWVHCLLAPRWWGAPIVALCIPLCCYITLTNNYMLKSLCQNLWALASPPFCLPFVHFCIIYAKRFDKSSKVSHSHISHSLATRTTTTKGNLQCETISKSAHLAFPFFPRLESINHAKRNSKFMLENLWRIFLGFLLLLQPLAKYTRLLRLRQSQRIALICGSMPAVCRLS